MNPHDSDKEAAVCKLDEEQDTALGSKHEANTHHHT